MSCNWEFKLPVFQANDNYSLSQLWHSIVGSIHQMPRNMIAYLFKGFEKSVEYLMSLFIFCGY